MFKTLTHVSILIASLTQYTSCCAIHGLTDSMVSVQETLRLKHVTYSQLRIPKLILGSSIHHTIAIFKTLTHVSILIASLTQYTSCCGIHGMTDSMVSVPETLRLKHVTYSQLRIPKLILGSSIHHTIAIFKTLTHVSILIASLTQYTSCCGIHGMTDSMVSVPETLRLKHVTYSQLRIPTLILGSSIHHTIAMFKTLTRVSIHIASLTQYTSCCGIHGMTESMVSVPETLRLKHVTYSQQRIPTLILGSSIHHTIAMFKTLTRVSIHIASLTQYTSCCGIHGMTESMVSVPETLRLKHVTYSQLRIPTLIFGSSIHHTIARYS